MSEQPLRGAARTGSNKSVAGSKPGTTASRAASRGLASKSSSRVTSRASLQAASGADLRAGKSAKKASSLRLRDSANADSAASAARLSEDEHSDATESGPKPPPPGIMPLFLTSMTQELFKVRAGEDVTAEKPIKLIPKADLLSDLQARLAIGDFYPAKQVILDFPGEELLLHYDAEFKYGQNFFLCITTDAMDEILHPVIEEQPVENVISEIPKPVSRKWESLGSDKEIEAEKYVPTRDLISVKATRRRRHFGKPCHFADHEANESYWECKSFKDANYDLARAELSMGIQAVPPLVETSSQTTWYRPLNFSAQYEPIDLLPEAKQEILSSDEMADFIREVTLRFEKAIQQNSIVDIFQDDYQEMGEEEATLEQGSHTYLQEYQSFTDLRHSKDKCLSCVDWHPTLRGVVAVSCTERFGYDERIARGLLFRSRKSLILVWNFHDPIHPQLILEAPEDVQCFQFNPLEPNIIAGGCVNGQIVIWDIAEYHDKLKVSRRTGATSGSRDQQQERVSETPSIHWVAVSSIEASHRGSITDLQWLPRNMELGHNGELVDKGDMGHKQLVTSSLDGQMAFWDTRYKKDWKSLDLVWRPFLRVPLSAMDNTFDYSLTKVNIRRLASDRADVANLFPLDTPSSEKKPPEFSSKFFSATEEGDLIYADWIAEKAGEEKASRVEQSLSYHFGAMSDLQRSPFFPDVILSTGGWSFHVWKEDVLAGPLLSSAPSSASVVCGRWSPTRPGVFYISKYDGTIEVWDLLDRSHSASSVQNVSGSAISYLAVRQYPGHSASHNQFIAVGDDEGTLHILEVPRNLTRPARNEKSFVASFFEREVRRLAYVRERRDFRAKERARFEQAAMEAAAGGPRPPSAAQTGLPEDQDERAELEYMKLERNFLEMEGLIPPAAA
ncbi:WD40-repeat-containing domain protein [Gaertneriomyces semiglobifer]|nr:WD40-repeat-containing domain protein [Gaertneriomyces semiglobifer]